MTVANSLNKHTYLGNGATIEFPYTFKIFKTTDIVVTLTEIATGADTIIASNYTVNTSTNVVQYPVSGTPLSSLFKITLNRKVPITQETALPNGGPYLAKTIETAFDKDIIIAQQQQEQLSRSLMHSVSVDSDISNELPAPVALSSFRWNAAADKLETTLDPAVVLTSVEEAVIATQAAQTAAELAQAEAESLALQNFTGIMKVSDIITKGPWVDVRSFGATGDGVTDDTAAIQAAVTFATSNVFFPEGTYLISSTIVKNLVLGEFKSCNFYGVPGASVLKWIGADYGVMIRIAGNNGRSPLLVEGLCFNLNSKATVGVEASGHVGYKIENNHFISSLKNVADDAGCITVLPESHAGEINHNAFVVGTAMGICLNHGNTGSINVWEIANNRFQQVYNYIIRTENVSNMSIHHNTVDGLRTTAQKGMYLLNSNGKIDGNRMESINESAIKMVNSSGIIENNDIQNCGVAGGVGIIDLSDCVNLDIYKNSFYFPAGGAYPVKSVNGVNIKVGRNKCPAYSIVGTDGQTYHCILDHVADSTNRPITGANWATYWAIGGTVSNVWVTGTTYLADIIRKATYIGTFDWSIDFPTLSTLTDYTTGTFTPIVAGKTTAGAGTYTIQSGTYTKVGKLVHVDIILGWSAHTGTGVIKIDGLPYPISYSAVPCNVVAYNLTYTGQLSAYVVTNTIELLQMATGAAYTGVAMDTSVTELRISATYITT